MNEMNTLKKKKIVEWCRQLINERIEEMVLQGKTLQDGVANESKSSAGDKHETARAMMNLEQEKLGRQYQELMTMKEYFDKINFEIVSDKILLGSIIETNKGYFLLSVGLGKVSFHDQDVLLLSLQSPLGEALIGKHVGEKIQMNSFQYIIESIQ